MVGEGRRGIPIDNLRAAYHEAISTVVRRGAPLATWSIDRRCLYSYTEAVSDDGVESLLCFSCARRFSHLKSRQVNEISMKRAVEEADDARSLPMRFFGMPCEQTRAIFGKEAYMERYGDGGEDGPNLHEQPQAIFADWILTVPFPEASVDIICCPEDHECSETCA